MTDTADMATRTMFGYMRRVMLPCARRAFHARCGNRRLIVISFCESATLATQLGVPVAPDFVEWIGAEDHFLARGEIDIRVDVNAYLAQRRASLLAHHSQGASPDGSSRMLSIAAALPDEVFGLAFGVEWYRRTGAAGPVEAVLSA